MMTTTFPSKDAALQMGIYYARGKNDIRPKDLKQLEDITMDQFGHTFPVEVYEVENTKGEKGQLGIENFRDGYALWLISPGGMSRRA